MTPSTREPLRVPGELWRHVDVRRALDGRDIGAVFRMLHKYAGASQTRIGIAVGMVQGAVSLYMDRGRVVTAIDVLERVAEGLVMPDEARVRLGLAPRGAPDLSGASGRDDELDALELAPAGAPRARSARRQWPGWSTRWTPSPSPIRSRHRRG